jgi:hypothetical protein
VWMAYVMRGLVFLAVCGSGTTIATMPEFWGEAKSVCWWEDVGWNSTDREMMTESWVGIERINVEFWMNKHLHHFVVKNIELFDRWVSVARKVNRPDQFGCVGWANWGYMRHSYQN